MKHKTQHRLRITRKNKKSVTNERRIPYSLLVDVAVVGMACRLPKAVDKEVFWENLKGGIDSIEEISPERWGDFSWYDPDPQHEGTSHSKWGGFIADVDKFDPLFFGISPREAEMMDPRQRIFLEECWKCLEDGGYAPHSLSNRQVGVFIGAGSGDYLELMRRQGLGYQGGAFTGSSQAILAARISYFLNLKGPSLSIDTACSSSLVALDRACKSIQLDESELALAGGVSLMNTPVGHIWASQVGMLSKDGRCKTFDDTADGMVPGEGVGVLLLKPLDKAVEDGDRIYGVIKGSEVNQDGKTSGITAPSAKSQSELQEKIYSKYHIHPETISYVEAHGTGTKLGDPIEVDALTECFRKHTDKIHYCALGSVKTNIGHTAMAAGVSGVIKTLLMLKHQQLVPHLHYRKINSEITLEDSPFYINTELKKWETEHNEPRRAAISSFGFSGTNAHVVIEEYREEFPTSDATPSAFSPCIVPLSARNEERLQAVVQNMANYLDNASKTEELQLPDLAYTLQVGRESMEDRLALVVENIAELREQLINYQNGNRKHLLTGNVRKDNDNFIFEGNAGKSFIKTAIEDRELDALARIWVKGVAIEWNLLYEDHRPRKISLPTYPFVRERYWIPVLKEVSPSIEITDQLHPLLHRNISDFFEQKYQSVYTGQEVFLSDYQVRGQRIVPEVAYLELAREAGERSTCRLVTQFKDIEWLAPIPIHDHPQSIQVKLHKDQQEVSYQICSINGSASSEIIHGKGTLHSRSLQSPSCYDVAVIKSRLTKQEKGTTCYHWFHKLGLQYGSSFQGMDRLYHDDGEILSKLNLPIEGDYTLPPGILDSALQACIGFDLGKEINKLYRPSKIKEVTIYGDVHQTRWSYVRKSNTNPQNGTKFHYDIDLLAEEGEVLLRFREVAMQEVDHSYQLQEPVSEDRSHPHYYEAVWKEKSISEVVDLNSFQYTVVLGGGSVALAKKLTEILGFQVIVLNEKNKEENYLSTQELIQAKLKLKEKANILVIYRNKEFTDFGFLSGLLKASELENSRLTGKTIGVDNLSIKEIATLTEIIQAEQKDVTKEVRYLSHKREVLQLQAISEDPDGDLPVREKGVYLITGGTGGLGLAFAEYLSKRKDVRLILIGRSERSNVNASELERLRAEYCSCDITDKKSVFTLIGNVLKTYGKLHGIIHSAGILQDSFVHEKTKEGALQVLAPKIKGTLHLDEATQTIPLDFIVYCSSLSGVIGGIGQADYASANSWLDHHARYRNQLRAAGKRSGHTVSINWPYWKEGGMKMADDYLQLIQAHTGMKPLSTSDGIEALKAALRTSCDQFVVISGDPVWLKSTLGEPSSKKKSSTARKSSVRETLLDLLSKVFGFKETATILEYSFEELGADSILLMQFRNELEKQFDFPIHLSEIMDTPNVEEFLNYMESELPTNQQDFQEPVTSGQRVRVSDSTPKVSEMHDATGPKIPNTIFVLTPPRSGSTLFRVMLAGHSNIFAPPELHLLSYDSMGSRASHLQGGRKMRKDGLIQALATLYANDVELAKKEIFEWEQENVPIEYIYTKLHQKLSGRLLVDKTPTYGMEFDTLSRAESLFDAPVYIYLHRHPLAAMGSMVKNRFHKMAGSILPPWTFAENVWTHTNANIQQFFQAIPESRKLSVAYEDLVKAPRVTLKQICKSLHIDFEEEMCLPYDQSSKKMTNGPHGDSLMMGDPNFFKHTAIDPSLAEGWKPYVDRWNTLDQNTRDLAASLHYGSIEKENNITPHKKKRSARWDLKNEFPELEILQKEGQEPPIIWFAPILGRVDPYRKLAKQLVDGIPCYAVHSPHYINTNRPIDTSTIYHQAAYFADQIIKWREKMSLSPAIPIRLGGYSYGGIVAFETLSELQKRNTPVGQVVILDSVCPEGGFHKKLFDSVNLGGTTLDIAFNALFFLNRIECTAEEIAALCQINDDPELIEALLTMGFEKGLKGNKESYKKWIAQTQSVVLKNQTALSDYSVSELPQPEEVACLFIRRSKQEIFYELSEGPLTVLDKKRKKINQAYSALNPIESWKKLFPNFKHAVSPAKDHQSMLTDDKSIALIVKEIDKWLLCKS